MNPSEFSRSACLARRGFARLRRADSVVLLAIIKFSPIVLAVESPDTVVRDFFRDFLRDREFVSSREADTASERIARVEFLPFAFSINSRTRETRSEEIARASREREEHKVPVLLSFVIFDVKTTIRRRTTTRSLRNVYAARREILCAVRETTRLYSRNRVRLLSSVSLRPPSSPFHILSLRAQSRVSRTYGPLAENNRVRSIDRSLVISKRPTIFSRIYHRARSGPVVRSLAEIESNVRSRSGDTAPDRARVSLLLKRARLTSDGEKLSRVPEKRESEAARPPPPPLRPVVTRVILTR